MNGEGYKQGPIQESAFPKPDELSIEYLGLRESGGSEELTRLYGILKEWYGVGKEKVLKQVPTQSPIWDVRSLLKIAILTREGWDAEEIAEVFADVPEFRRARLNAGSIEHARRSYLKEKFLIPRKRPTPEKWEEEKTKVLASYLYTHQGYGRLSGAERDRAWRHVTYRGQAIRQEKRKDEAWKPWLSRRPGLTNTAAFLISYLGIDFDEGIRVALQIHQSSEHPVEWGEGKDKELAQALKAGKSYRQVAREWGLDGPGALINRVTRVGVQLLKKPPEPEWQAWKSKLSPAAAYIKQFTGCEFSRAVDLGKSIPNRGRLRSLKKKPRTKKPLG